MTRLQLSFIVSACVAFCWSSGSSKLLAAPVSVVCNSAAGLTPSRSTSSDGLSASCLGLPDRSLQGGNASASLSFGLESDGWYALRTTSSTSVSAGTQTAPGGTIPVGFGVAETHINWSQTYNSGGAVRAGYLYLQPVANPAQSYSSQETIIEGFADGTATSGAFTLNACRGLSNMVPELPGHYCNAGPGYFAAYGGYPVPVLLGTDMTLLVNANLNDFAAGYILSTGGSGQSVYRFRLTELDGSAVALLATPEPSTFAMLGLSLCVLYGVRRKLGNSQR